MKKLLSLLISGIISISLVGCTDTDNTDNEEDKTVNEEVIKEEDKTSENADKEVTDTTEESKESVNEKDDGYYRDEDGSPMIKKHGSQLGEKPWNKDDEVEEHPDSYYEDNSDDSNENSNYKGNAMDSEDGVIYQYKDDDGNTVKEYENGDIVTKYND